MIFDAPIPFREAVAHLAAKRVMPTAMNSAQLAGVSSAIKRNSFFSAQTVLTDLLDRYKAGIESIISPAQVTREGAAQPVTEGFNPASLRGFIKEYLRDIGYKPEEGQEGTIKDLGSDARINLVVDTNTKLANGAGQFVQANDPNVIDQWPAQELYRLSEAEQPRNWDGTNPDGEKKLTSFGSRWIYAAQASGDADAARVMEESGRMVALKSSGIWQALGDFEDGLGNPYPPFAFNSGMWVRDVTRPEAVSLGLMEAGDEAAPADFDFGSLFKLPDEA